MEEKNYISYVTVKTVFGEEVLVPTKEEYKYFRENVSYYLERLGSRIAALEGDRNSVPTKESPDNKKTKIALMNCVGDVLELEGTEKQIEVFEAERKERNDLLFPSAMSFMKTAELALEHGLTVKKVVTR